MGRSIRAHPSNADSAAQSGPGVAYLRPQSGWHVRSTTAFDKSAFSSEPTAPTSEGEPATTAQPGSSAVGSGLMPTLSLSSTTTVSAPVIGSADSVLDITSSAPAATLDGKQGSPGTVQQSQITNGEGPNPAATSPTAVADDSSLPSQDVAGILVALLGTQSGTSPTGSVRDIDSGYITAITFKPAVMASPSSSSVSHISSTNDEDASNAATARPGSPATTSDLGTSVVSAGSGALEPIGNATSDDAVVVTEEIVHPLQPQSLHRRRYSRHKT